MTTPGLELNDLFRAETPRDPVQYRRVLADVTRGLFGHVAAPIHFGRYLVLDRIGSGGGGVVYRGYDPELGRMVAIKLLLIDEPPSEYDTGERSPGASALLDEARAMAQLSHPNVVAVHDVGSRRDAQGSRCVFIVMELVEGMDLSRWLAAERRSWREIARVFVEAGRGLAAAHAAGLVHGDFKPANVFLGTDAPHGRVRVGDFGLARGLADIETPLATSQPDTLSTTDAPPARAGLEGTLPYLAPERYAGAPADARTDQYAFCVAMWEALWGRRPFEAKDLDGWARAKAAGAPATVPRRPRIPRGIRRALERGMDPAPDRRHASMAALLSRIDPSLRWRRLLVMGPILVLSTAALAVFATVVAEDRRASACSQPADTPSLPWDDQARARANAAFAATGLPFATTAWSHADGEMTRYVSELADARAQACRAAIVDGTRSLSQLSQEIACLDRALLHAGEIATALEAADARVVSNIRDALTELVPIERCENVDALEPTAPSTRDLAVAVENELARSASARLRGELVHAEEAIDRALALAQPGADRRLRTRVLRERSLLARVRGSVEAREVALREALHAAESARDEATAIAVMAELVHVLGSQAARPDEALRLADHVEARLAAAGATADQRAMLAYSRAAAENSRGRTTEAMAHALEALRLLEQNDLAGGRGAIDVTNMLGVIAEAMGDEQAALEHYERAAELLRLRYGEGHPDVAFVVANTGLARWRVGDHALAIERLSEARLVLARFYDADAPELARVHNNLAVALVGIGRASEAEPEIERALAIRRRALGDDHPDVAQSLTVLADVRAGLGDLELAIAAAEEAVAIAERGPSTSIRALAEGSLGAQLRRAGRCEAATPWLERAHAAAVSRQDPHSTFALEITEDLVLCDLTARRDQAARRQLARAIAGYEQRGREPSAGALAALAWIEGGDVELRARAERLAERDPAERRWLDEVDAHLTRIGRSR